MKVIYELHNAKKNNKAYRYRTNDTPFNTNADSIFYVVIFSKNLNVDYSQLTSLAEKIIVLIYGIAQIEIIGVYFKQNKIFYPDIFLKLIWFDLY